MWVGYCDRDNRRRECPLDFASSSRRGAETLSNTAAPPNGVHSVPLGRTFHKRGAHCGENFPDYERVRRKHVPCSAMAQTPTLTKWRAYLLQRSTFCLEMWVPLSLVEYVDPPNTPTPISLAAPVVYREGAGEIPTDA